LYSIALSKKLFIMTAQTDLELAIDLQHRENMNFIATNALSPGRMEQIRSFEADCQSARSMTTAIELQETFDKLRIQECNDQNFARRLAGLPTRVVPPLAPLAPLSELNPLPKSDLPFLRKSLLKSTREHLLPANLNQVNRLSSLPNLQSLPDLNATYLSSLKSTGESTSYTQFNQLGIYEESKSLDYLKEDKDKLAKAFPRQKVKKNCEVCRELVEMYSLFPCGHNYCNMCIAKVFQSAIGDRSLIPIKCCRVEIDQNLAEYVLSTDDFNKFREILHEVETKEKMYW
jgi:hypothetical protein